MYHLMLCFLVDFLAESSIHWWQWGIKVPYSDLSFYVHQFSYFQLVTNLINKYFQLGQK